MRTTYQIDDCDLDAPTATVDVMLETERKTLIPPPLPGAAAPLAQLEAEVEAFRLLRDFRIWLQDHALADLTLTAVCFGTARYCRQHVMNRINTPPRTWRESEKKISGRN